MAAEGVLLERGDPHVDRKGLPVVTVDARHALRRGGKAVGKFVVVKDAKAQERAAKAEGIVVVDAPDWSVIPLENLIAARADRPGTLFALARRPEQAALFAETLEVGVHGIVLAPPSTAAIFETDRLLRERRRPVFHDIPRVMTVREAALAEASAAGSPPARTAVVAPPAPKPAANQEIPAPTAHAAAQPRPKAKPPLRAGGGDAAASFLEPARVLSVGDGGMGDRVCIDTTSLLRDGEGLLMGSTARSFVLVHGETEASAYLAARPFRVNAGAVHSYLYAPEGKTRYLSELQSGQPVLAVHPDGIHRVLTIGRVKIERRPHTLVRWRAADGSEGGAVLQTAETVCLVRPDGKRVRVTDLKPGDEVLVHGEPAGRHAGHPVEGRLEER